MDALTPSIVYKKVIVLGTKGDLPQTEITFKELTKQYSDRFPIIIGTSVEKNSFPENFGEIVLKFLNKIKIYTMNSAGKIADKPMILSENMTVKDAALKIHKSFLELFQYAIIIRERSLQKRKKVGLDYKLEDKDIIEIHTT
ncbi:MAG TPA: TGS domain-containing protein [Candidatus Lokiarchaeia archaeon]